MTAGGMIRSIRFEPTLSFGHLLQAVVILVAGTVFAVRLEARIEINEVRLQAIEARVERSEARAERALMEIRTDMAAVKQAVLAMTAP